MKKKIFYILAATMIFLAMAGATAMAYTSTPGRSGPLPSEGQTDTSSTQTPTQSQTSQTANNNLSYEEASNRAQKMQQDANRLQESAENQRSLASQAAKAAAKAEQEAVESERILEEEKARPQDLSNLTSEQLMENIDDAMDLEQQVATRRDAADKAKEEAEKLNETANKAKKAATDAKQAATQANTAAEEIKLAEEQAAIDANWKPLKPTLIPKPDLLPGPGTEAQKDANSGAKSILVDTILPNLTLGMIGFCGLWALVFLIVGSVRFMTSYGNEEAAKKAKEQIVYSIVGFMIALLAYAIVTIIINLKIEGDTSRPTSLIETAYAETAFAKGPLDSIPSSCEKNTDCGSNKICFEKLCQSQSDILMPKPGQGTLDITEKYTDTKYVAGLPSVSMENIFTTIIKSVLGWSMILTIIAIVVAAVFYLTSQGKEENTTKAKGILINLLIGLAIMAAAYGIIAGIAQFNFFTAAPQ